MNNATAFFEPISLRQNRLFESYDLDDTRERISRVMQPHELTPLALATGRRSHMDFVRIGGLGLGTIDFGASMRVDVGHVDDYHLLMFCLRGHAEVNAGGRELYVSQGSGMICAPGSAFTADLSPDCEQFVLRLDRTMVESHLGRSVRFDERLDLTRPGLQAWLAQLQVLVTSPSFMDTARRNPLIACEIERLLVHLLVEGQACQDVDLLKASKTPAPASACVKRAEGFIEAHADEPLRLADIANAADVPVRTLLDAFKRFRDASPMQYLRDVRLDMARAKLESSAGLTTVAQVALDCGFAHLGRFSQSYRERFGQTPSATLGCAR